MDLSVFSETPLSMQRNREVFVQQIKRELGEYFSIMGISDHEYYGLDEVLERIKSSNTRFSPEVIRKIFQSVKPTHMDKCSGKQLKESYLKRRWELQTMLDTCTREFEALEQLRQQAENNLRRFENVANKYEEEESKLMIQVVSLDLQKEMSFDSSYKIHLECQDQVIETQPKRYQHDKKCVFWNELFSFEVERKFGVEGNLLEISLLDGRNQVQLGECSLILDELADQRKHELKKEVYAYGSGVSLGSLLISCQWLYSKHILYKSYLREFKQKRDQKIEDLNTYQNELASLDEPFLPKSSSPSLYIYLSSIPDFLANKLDNSLKQLRVTGPDVLYKYVIFISFLLQWIASATRSCYLDSVTTCYIFWCNLGNESFTSSRWTDNGFKFVLSSISVSLVLDIFWMNIFFPAWSVSSEEGDLRNFSKVFTFFNFMWKIILFFIIWKSRSDFVKFQQYDEALLRKNRQGSLTLQSHLGAA
ncbi:multi-pass transmembrane protein [Cryptosporidium felis]|nr:multi-pass transmembrane protein [Cryptosporidium felis]